MPSILNKSPTPPAEIQLQTRTDPPPSFIVGYKHMSLNCSSFLLCKYCHRFVPYISNFDSSLHKTLFHCSAHQFLCFCANLSRLVLVLFPFRRCVFLTATQPFRSFLMSDLLTVDECTCFPDVWASSAAKSKLGFLLFLKDVIFRYVPSFLVRFCGLPLCFLSWTFPAFCCFVRIAWDSSLTCNCSLGMPLLV